MTPAPRRPRADAVRNRARLLAVAEEVFGEKGTSASTEEVAKAAGVGIGTVFRHFPTKESLLEAVFVEHLRGVAERAREYCDAPDPGAAFRAFFRDVVSTAPRKLALADALTAVGVDVEAASEDIRAELAAALAELLSRAQAAGAVRLDLGMPDLQALLIGASRAADHLAGDIEGRERTLDVVLDGMRPGAGTWIVSAQA
ncbi:TetR/AcrR family transcriptional regulator [Yinghuangia sp. YIM S10712]|uniref:TetR/AcrR family transcriptional regulator n=1 Tax=Yinghuangia sp. YIM S10712 TaxID=3436930 RepID=UPI003F52E323